MQSRKFIAILGVSAVGVLSVLIGGCHDRCDDGRGWGHGYGRNWGYERGYSAPPAPRCEPNDRGDWRGSRYRNRDCD